MMTFREIIDAFGYASLAAALRLPPGTVSAWKTRGSIPHQYWREIQFEARKRRLRGVTYSALEAAARPRRRRDTAASEAHP